MGTQKTWPMVRSLPGITEIHNAYIDTLFPLIGAAPTMCLSWILRHAADDPNGRVRFTLDEIGGDEATGLSRPSIISGLRTLVDYGVVIRESVTRGPGGHQVYRLTPLEDWNHERMTAEQEAHDRRVRHAHQVRLDAARLGIRATVLARSGDTCHYCGAHDVPLQIDHVIPVSRGGTSALDNLVACCATCNRSKKNKTPEEWHR